MTMHNQAVNKYEMPKGDTPDPHEISMLALELSEEGQHEIDLHGETADMALSRLDTFLHQELMAGAEAFKIIHGKGNDILRPRILTWLEKQKANGLVAAYRGATVSSGQQNAVTLVALHSLKS